MCVPFQCLYSQFLFTICTRNLILTQQSPIHWRSVSFKLYDLDGNGYIDKQELFVMLRSSMMENATLELNERQLNELVEQTLTMVSLDHDRISFSTPPYFHSKLGTLFFTFCNSNPILLKMTTETLSLSSRLFFLFSVLIWAN